MLLEMRIENFILIEKLNISFSEKLNVFTGETGAGKSMIIGGLNVGLGEKVTSDIIRNGADKAVIQLVFSISNQLIIDNLNEFGVELEEGILIITREIHQSNRSVIRMNGRISTITVLRSISNFLMDIHGQHAHQTLLYPKNHLYYLDLMGDRDHLRLKDSVATAYKDVKEKQQQLYDLESEAESNVDVNYINFQMDEIDQLNLTTEDEDQLSSKFEYYKNLESIHKNVNNVAQIISGEHEINGIKEMIHKSIQLLSDVAHYNKKLTTINEQFNEVLYSVEDIQTEIRHFTDSMDVDEKEMYEVEQRMNAINELKLKHGRTVGDILFKRQQLAEQIKAIENKEEHLTVLKAALTTSKKEYLKVAKHLEENRKFIKDKFVVEVTSELYRLNMDNCRFDVRFQENNLAEKEFRLSPTGFDIIEFVISTNPGMPLSPLAKIASGGEISRIMLAIKVALSNNDIVDCLVFDEVDTGISGATAIVVGEKIQKITNNYQILCITHLSQIAVMADQHLLLSKKVEDGMTSTNVMVLNDDAKVNEIARMLSGDETSLVSIQNAKEMLSNARRFKDIS